MTPAVDSINGMELVLFWVMAVLAVTGGLGLLFARKAVHAAMAMAMTLVSLGIIYVGQGAEFVGIIQVFVYSGAVMMLFLFVVMLVGVDASDTMVDTLRGQRFWSFLIGALFAAAAVYGLTRVDWPDAVGLEAVQAEGTVTALAREIFERQVLGFEALGALLVIAVMGAMVLAHRERLTPTPTQSDVADARLRSGRWLAGKPNPGIYARHNAADTPALGPDGEPVEVSVPRVLVARGQVQSPSAFALPGSPGATDTSAKRGSESHDTTEGGTDAEEGKR